MFSFIHTIINSELIGLTLIDVILNKKRLKIIFPLLLHSQSWMCQYQFRFCLLAERNNKLRFMKRKLTGSRPLRKSSKLWMVQVARLSHMSMCGSKYQIKIDFHELFLPKDSMRVLTSSLVSVACFISSCICANIFRQSRLNRLVS